MQQESWEPLAGVLAPHVEKLFDELPEALRERIKQRGGWVARRGYWNMLAPERRQILAQQSDDHSNPALQDAPESIADFFIGFWEPHTPEGKGRVRYWLKRRAVSANEAARLLCGDDPIENPQDRTPAPLDAAFNLLHGAFCEAAQDGRSRSLHDWIAVAQHDEHLRHLEYVPAWAACSAVFIADMALLRQALEIAPSGGDPTPAVELAAPAMIQCNSQAAQRVSTGPVDAAGVYRVSFLTILQGIQAAIEDAPKALLTAIRGVQAAIEGSRLQGVVEPRDTLAPAVEGAIADGPQAAPKSAETAPQTNKPPMSRAGLVRAHQAQWPTIETDLNKASENGLAAAAKCGVRGWDEAAALEWARSKGKLHSSATTAPRAGPFDSLGSGRVHRIKG